jgi:hypothetical protein
MFRLGAFIPAILLTLALDDSPSSGGPMPEFVFDCTNSTAYPPAHAAVYFITGTMGMAFTDPPDAEADGQSFC